MSKLIQVALKYYGKREVEGPKSDPWVLSIIKKLFPYATDDSKISWCSIFIHHLCDEAGIQIPKDKNSGLARSWLKFGKPITLEHAEPGDIVIFWRESVNSWKGHVALYVNDRGNGMIRVLGGNQNDSVSIASYEKSRILGIRRL